MKIGIFDSGIGGLTLARPFLSTPNIQITYVADTANMPYGIKSPKHIQRISSIIVNFLASKQVDLIIIACHTASLLAGQQLRKMYPHIQIITMQDTIISQALTATKNNRIGIIATPGTIKSSEYKEKFATHKKKIKLITQACPTLAPAIEKYFNKPEQLQPITNKYLHAVLAQNIDTLILGCTHYALIKDIIRAMAPNISLISSDEAITDHIKTGNYLSLDTMQNKHQFFVSGSRVAFQEKLAFFLHAWEIAPAYSIDLAPWNIITEKNQASSSK